MADFDYLSVGEHNFKKFVQTIKKLFINEKKNFDLIIGTGNSGVVMAKFVEMILKELDIKIPPTLIIPILRFSDSNEENEFDNGILLELVKWQLHDINKIENVLFVDDEIFRGISVKTAIQLIMEAKSLNNLNVTIVAEDQGFQLDKSIPNVGIKFYPFSKEIEGHNNAIFYMIPCDFDNLIKSIFPENVLKWYNRMNVLMGLPIRIMRDGVPTYSYKYSQEAKEKMKDFKKLQDDFLIHVKHLIKQSLYEK